MRFKWQSVSALQVNGERIGIDFDANLHDENPTEFLVTQWKDQNGRVLIDIDNVTVAAADEGG